MYRKLQYHSLVRIQLGKCFKLTRIKAVISDKINLSARILFQICRMKVLYSFRKQVCIMLLLFFGFFFWNCTFSYRTTVINFNIRSPWDSILDAVLTVSPNKQYLGIFRPTTPATHDPEWIPIRSFIVSSSRCRILKLFIASKRCSDIEAISPACIVPFRLGRPLTTM